MLACAICCPEQLKYVVAVGLGLLQKVRLASWLCTQTLKKRIWPLEGLRVVYSSVTSIC